MKKRFLIPFLIVILMITTAVASVIATAAEVDTFGMTLEAKAPGSTSHFSTAKPGEEIELSVMITDNFEVGIMLLQSQISFDIDALEFVSAEKGEVFPANVDHVAKVNTSKKVVTIQIIDNQARKNNGTGTLITLKFKVKEGYKGEIDGFAFKVLQVRGCDSDYIVPNLDGADLTNAEDKIYACTFGEPVVVEASCTAPGSITYTCTDCGEKVVIPNGEGGSGHKPVVDQGKDPTCDVDGLTEGSHCEICGETITAQTVIPAPGHKYGAWEQTKAPTETAKGEEAQTCSVCGDVQTRELPMLEHSCKAHIKAIAVKAATCTTTGTKAHYKCDGCNKLYEDADATREITDASTLVIPLAEHTAAKIPAKAATCTDAGNTEGIKCSVCGHIMQATTSIPAKGHNEVAVAGREATCLAEGLTNGTKCSVCNVAISAQQVIPKKAHTEVALPAKEATCTQTGLTAGTKCSVCNTVTLAQQTIPTKTHTFGEWVVVKNATETEDGLMERTCSVCTNKETAVIPKVPAPTTEPEPTTDPEPSTSPDETTPEDTTTDEVVTTDPVVTTDDDNKGGAKKDNDNLLGIIVIVVAIVAVGCVVVLVLTKKKK